MEFFQFCFDRAHIAPISRNWNPIGENSFHKRNSLCILIWQFASRRCLISFKRLIVRKWNRDDIPYNNKSVRQRIAISCKWRHESEIIRVYECVSKFNFCTLLQFSIYWSKISIFFIVVAFIFSFTLRITR